MSEPTPEQPAAPLSALDEFLIGDIPVGGRADSEPTKPKRERRNWRERLGIPESEPRPEPKAEPKRKEPPVKANEFVEPLIGMYTMLGVGVGMRDMQCGSIIVENAEACANAWQELAKKNEAVRRALRSMTQASAVSGVIVAHLPILLAVTSHHAPQLMPGVKESNNGASGETTVTVDGRVGTAENGA